MQADILDRGPHNRQAAALGREDVKLRCLTLLKRLLMAL
jgi:hypothetical protein